ncbi:unnamed protein product [Gongylonema pulchrum]|uniref:Secreted protein n=1 Tax=Gongylonema pulchrum TaxID=637853 RepID=A0A183EXL6_9BILA|nr:unnamed protein product [Gongylonema pulchrum]
MKFCGSVVVVVGGGVLVADAHHFAHFTTQRSFTSLKHGQSADRQVNDMNTKNIPQDHPAAVTIRKQR